MAAHTLTYKPWLIHSALVQAPATQLYKFVKRLIPQPRMLFSAGLLLVGWSIPLLMLLELIPTTLFFSFVGFALAATGSVLLLFYLGDL